MFNASFRIALLIAATLAALLLAGCESGMMSMSSDSAYPASYDSGDESAFQFSESESSAQSESVQESPPPAPPAVAQPAGGADVVPPQDEIQARYASLRRVIVRTARVDLVVDDIQPSLDSIAAAAKKAEGWVVSNVRTSLHSGSISVRVPADSLDDFIETLRQMSVEVISESTGSQDVTEEYYDLRARLDNMLATQARMLEFLKLAPDARQALDVQRELNELQTEIERHKGRIRLLEETSAFSLVTVSLTLAAREMPVSAGPDRTEAAGEQLRFRATFEPPRGVTDFATTWDFGDGSTPVTVHRTAPASETGRFAQTVVHAYSDPVDSPFIARVTIRGTGDGGVAEGEDTLIVSVSELPQIQLYAERSMDVEQGDETVFAGSFTRPEGLRNVSYEWDFGDGSPAASGDLPEGVTRATATHVYENYREYPYTARLTITADSDAGEASASWEVGVKVRETRGFVVAGYDLGNTFKSAVRALSVAVQIFGTLLVWALVFSPVLAALGGLVWLIIRLDARSRAKRQASTEAKLRQLRETEEKVSGSDSALPSR